MGGFWKDNLLERPIKILRIVRRPYHARHIDKALVALGVG
jgi:hypothetical protein